MSKYPKITTRYTGTNLIEKNSIIKSRRISNIRTSQCQTCHMMLINQKNIYKKINKIDLNGVNTGFVVRLENVYTKQTSIKFEEKKKNS